MVRSGRFSVSNNQSIYGYPYASNHCQWSALGLSTEQLQHQGWQNPYGLPNTDETDQEAWLLNQYTGAQHSWRFVAGSVAHTNMVVDFDISQVDAFRVSYPDGNYPEGVTEDDLQPKFIS